MYAYILFLFSLWIKKCWIFLILIYDHFYELCVWYNIYLYKAIYGLRWVIVGQWLADN